MRVATRTAIVAGLAASLAACGGGGNDAAQDQNITIDNVGAEDIEALPADESSVTPSDALVNGTTDDANATTADNQTDSY
ncbi:MAG TPA: hypothetical protein VD768_00965 [Sphingomicrobium sp.]|nr:hypothetical protein [Sphingomicrobium sp.]